MNKRRNKFVSALLVISMVLPTIPIFTVPVAAASGNWKESGNYDTTVAAQSAQSFTISTAAQLAGFAVSVNSGKNYSGYTVTLGADINMDTHYWETIGNTTANYFAGTFDGAGHTISNLTYYNHGGQYYGLFGYTNGATIKNLKFTASMNLTGVSSASETMIYCGGLVGSATNTKIYDCEFGGATSTEFYLGVTDTYLAMGGIAGKLDSSSEVISCIVNPVVKYTLSGQKSFVGGIAGLLGNNSKIINCTANKVNSSGTNVTEADVIGGIVGELYYLSSIDSCKTLLPIAVVSCTASSIYAGGIVGYGYGDGSATNNKGSYIRNCAPSSSEVVLSGTASTKCVYGGIAAYFVESYAYNNYAAAPCNASGVTSSTKNIGAAFGISNSTTKVKGIFYQLSAGIGACCADGIPTYTNAVLLSSGVYASVNSSNGVSFTSYASVMLNGGDTDITTAADTNAIPYPITWTGTSTASLSDWVNPGNYDIATAYATTSNITITTAKQLAGIAAAVRLYGKDYSGCTITLGADIDLSAYPWVAIAVGTFDGAGHTISGLNVDTGYNYFGLFSTATMVKDLTVSGSVDAVTNAGRATNIYVGGIAGKPVTITNCTSSAIVTYNANCTSSGIAYIGSMGGEVSSGTITNCVATGSVTANSYRLILGGGLFGSISSTAAFDCSATGAVTISNQSVAYGMRVGGLFGVAQTSSNILNSFATGAVSAPGSNSNAWSVGGFIGMLNSSTAKNCYSTGSVTGSTYGGNFGGFVGTNESSSTITNSYSSGTVSASAGASGGLVGYSSGSTLTDCYWIQNGSYNSATKYTSDTVGTNTINNVTMLTAEQMANESVPDSTSVGTSASTYTGKYFLPALNAATASISNAKNWYDAGSIVAFGGYAATVTVKVNGIVSSAAVTSSMALYNGTTLSSILASDTSNGVYTGYVLAGTYNIYVDGIDTNVDITITTSGGNAAVNYNTVAYTVANAGTATGSAISAMVSGSAITTGAYVLSGKQVIITASGAGANSYAYVWTGTTGGGTTSAGALSISSLNVAVNAICTVTGTNAIAVTINLDGIASSSPAALGVALYSGAVKTTDMAISAAGIYTASVSNGTYDVYVNGADTGIDLAVSSGVGSATVNYCTVEYQVANIGAAGSTISATASGSAITSGAYVLSGKEVVITASGAGANSYAYAWGGSGTSAQTTAAITIATSISAINATCTVTGINTATVTINLNGSASSSPATSGVALYSGTTKTVDMTSNVAGIFTASAINGTYNVYVNDADTGIDLTVSSGVGSATVNYCTVEYQVANIGAAGSTISATASGSAITSGAYVLSGKEVVITASGAGANSYAYAWGGSGTSAQTTAAITIATSISAINATCTVTGINTATVTINLNGSASSSPATSGVALYSGTTKTVDMTSNVAGIFTASAINGTYNVYVNDADTGIDLTVSSGVGSAAVNYCTVEYQVSNIGAAGSTISATASGSAITSGTYVLSGKEVVITAVGAGANSYAYAWGGTTGGGTTSAGALSISSLSSAVNATCTVTGINAIAVTINLDGTASSSPATSGVALYIGATKTTDMAISAAGIYTASVANGTYDVYVNGADTGIDLTVSSGVGSAAVNYFTVEYQVSNIGAAGSTISAMASGNAITSGTYVLSGKPVVITAVGAGANSYAYAWGGSGTSAQTTAAITIASLSGAVNATCTVTGINAIAVTINLDGTASSSPATSGVALYIGATKTTDMAISAAGIYTASVANGTYDVYVNGADTGIDLTVSSGVGSAAVNYFTVAYTVANAGTATGSAISATASGSAITSGAYVLSGKQVIITATGAGANSYAYAWGGTTGGGTTSAGALSISSLSSAVNATCTVTGTNEARENIDLGGSAGLSLANLNIIDKKEDKASVIIGGESYDDVMNVETGKTNDGRTEATITLNEKTKDVIDNKPDGTSFKITFPRDYDINNFVLTSDIVKKMEEKSIVLDITANSSTYALPAADIKINDVEKSFEDNVALKDITVKITISTPDANMSTETTKKAEEGGFSIVAPAVDFAINCTYKNNTVAITEVDSYVQNTTKLPDEITPEKITTAIHTNKDGEFHHVPTKITIIDGVYYAVVNSMISGTFNFVYHPVCFPDVENHWSKAVVNDMASRFIVYGYESGLYIPDGDITRAEFTAIVIRAMGLPEGMGTNTFTNVPANEWYCGYVSTACKYGLISGYSPEEFGPNDKITREQAITIIARMMEKIKYDVSLAEEEKGILFEDFEDNTAISDYAKDSIAICIKSEIVVGRGETTDAGISETTIKPKAFLTRAEAAALVQRVLSKSGLI